MAIHNLGKEANDTSYPQSKGGPTGTGDPSLGVANHNFNKVNFECDPPVFNESPATKKSYRWNKSPDGNANG